MARIKSYAQDTNITDQDRILGTSYEGLLNNKPIYKTRNYKVTDLASYFSQNFDFEGVNYNLSEIKNYQINLANSLGGVNQDGSLANISINFANDLVSTVSTVPDLFTELALSNLSAIPQTFADFIFTIADINEAFANQVLDLSTSTAYAQLDTFNALSTLVDQIDTNVQGLQVNVTNVVAATNANTGNITANANALTALGVRVTTAESDVVALNSSFTSLEIIVNENTGDVSTNATSITTLGTVVDTATTDIATLKTDVTLLESSIDTLSGDVTANASDISLLTTNVDTVTADVTALETDVTTLTTTVNNNTGDIATQATQVSLLANRVTTTESNILNTQTDVTSLTTTVDGNTGNISTNASNISILQTNVSTQQAQITGIITDIQQIETSVDNVTGDVEANAIAISGIGTRVTTAEGEIDNVQGNITTLTTNLNTQTGRIDTNVQNISTLSTSITDPATGLVALQGQITTVDNARISGDEVLTTRANLIEAKADSNLAAITAESTARANADSANASYSFNIASSIGSVDANGNITAVSEAFANSIINTETTSSYATASQIDALSARVGDTESDITAEQTARANADSANATYSFNVASSIGSVNANGNITAVSEAFANSIISTETTGTYATATQLSTLSARVSDTEADITDIETVVAYKPNVYRQTSAPTGSIPIKSVWYDTDDNNKPYVYESGGWVEVRDGKVTELETYALAQKTLEADANGVITGITIKSENSGGAAPPISDITFKTNTFNIVDQSNNVKLNLNSSGDLSIVGSLTAGLVNIDSNVITFGAADSSYSQTGKIRFNNYLGTQIGELRTSSGVAGGAPRSTITIETLGGGVGLDPVLSLRSGYGWDIGGSNMGAIYGYRVDGINKLNLFADLVLLNSGPFLSSTGYQRIWGNFTIQWVRRTYTSGQQVPATSWPIAFTTIFGAVISKGNPFLTYQTQNEAASVSYTTSSYFVDLNSSSGGTFFIIALGMIADPT